jgi:hypothetical protein
MEAHFTYMRTHEAKESEMLNVKLSMTKLFAASVAYLAPSENEHTCAHSQSWEGL